MLFQEDVPVGALEQMEPATRQEEFPDIKPVIVGNVATKQEENDIICIN